MGDLSSTNGGKASSKDEEVILANGVGNLEFLIGFFFSASKVGYMLCYTPLALHAMRQSREGSLAMP